MGVLMEIQLSLQVKHFQEFNDAISRREMNHWQEKKE